MPQTKKNAGGNWGITWAEVQQAEAEHASHYSCRIEWVAVWVALSPGSEHRRLSIACYAISGRPGPGRISGYAQCMVGSARGAASVPGAYLRSMMDACRDLDERRCMPKYNRDSPVPGRIWDE